MRRTLRALTLAITLGEGLALGFGPRIPRERIPEDAPREIRRRIQQLYSPDAAVRGMAAVRLGQMGDLAQPAIPFLLSMLDDSVSLEWERTSTESPLEHARRVLMGLYKEQRTSPGKEAALALGRLCTKAIPPLLEALKHQDPNVRVNAAIALSRIGDTAAVPALLPLLKDPEARVRAQAARSLGELGDRRAAQPLVEALRDPEVEVRKEAVRALGELREPETLGAMLEALKDLPPVRDAAERALLEVRDPRAVEPLILSLRHRSEEVRRISARLLGAIGDRRAVRPLILALKDPASDVRFEATRALQRISGEDYGADQAKWKRWWEIEQAARRIEESVGGDPVRAYIAALRQPQWAARAYGAKRLGILADPRAVRPLCPLLWDKDETVRLNTAVALGRIADPRAVEPLIAALTDADPRVQEAAHAALRKICRVNLGPETKKWTEWWEKNKEAVFRRYEETHKTTAARPDEPKPRRASPTRQTSRGTVVLALIILFSILPLTLLIAIRIMRQR